MSDGSRGLGPDVDGERGLLDGLVAELDVDDVTTRLVRRVFTRVEPIVVIRRLNGLVDPTYIQLIFVSLRKNGGMVHMV